MDTTKTLTSKSIGQDMNNKGSIETHRVYPGIGLTNSFLYIRLYSHVMRERWPTIEEQGI